MLDLKTTACCFTTLVLSACGGNHEGPVAPADAPPVEDSEQVAEGDHGDHDHNEVPLESQSVDGMEIVLAQGHGPVVPGGESQLVVKLPYCDDGSTMLRAWLGTEDRTLSLVGLGKYAPSHDDYDIHVTAPEPLPEGMKWWFEIETPDGERRVGSTGAVIQ